MIFNTEQIDFNTKEYYYGDGVYIDMTEEDFRAEYEKSGGLDKIQLELGDAERKVEHIKAKVKALKAAKNELYQKTTTKPSVKRDLSVYKETVKGKTWGGKSTRLTGEKLDKQEHKDNLSALRETYIFCRGGDCKDGTVPEAYMTRCKRIIAEGGKYKNKTYDITHIHSRMSKWTKGCKKYFNNTDRGKELREEHKKVCRHF